MRRKDREITEIKDKLAVLDDCKVCVLAMIDGSEPYAVPLNFGYTWDGELTLYFHCAKEGRKIGALKANSRVCFEADCGHELKTGDEACAYGFIFKSVIGFGNVEFLESREEKAQGLKILMKHQTGKADWTFPDEALDGVCVLKLKAESFTGKQKK